MTRLQGKTVIVTGGAQGIGAVYAKSLAAEGANVAICDLRAPDTTVAEIMAAGGLAFGGVSDISDSQSIAAFVAATVDKFGSIEGLVNNAAVFSTIKPRPFDQIPWEEFDHVMQVNVRGTFEFIKGVVPTMRSAGYGKIVNIGSGTFFRGTPMLSHYVASKGAVVAMTRTLARELGGAGIRINCVAPGLTMSDSVQAIPEHFPSGIVRHDAETRCIVREQVPTDLTGTVNFLLSPDSDFITGQTVVVDGGSILH